MAIRTEAFSASRELTSVRATPGTGIGRLGRFLPFLLTLAGAVTVTVGSYMAWATFYAGLISRDGVAGHGKYFIGLSAASVLAVVLSMIPGVSRSLRLVIVPAGATIAFFAIRDLRNLDALISDPASGFYVPGHGHGLYVVIAGAFLLMIAAFSSSPLPSLRPMPGRSPHSRLSPESRCSCRLSMASTTSMWRRERAMSTTMVTPSA